MSTATQATWRKATYSQANGECVEVALPAGPAGVGIRDTKDPSRAVTHVSPAAWSAFIHATKSNDLTP